MISKKDLVFIFDDKDSLEFIKNLSLSDNTIIICKNADLEKKIQTGKFKTKQISDYYENLGINDKSLKWIKEWPDRIIKDDKNFKDYFIYKGISIFWYLESRFYHYRIQELILLIEIIRNVLQKEVPDRIWVKGSYDIEEIISKLQPKILQKTNLHPKLNRSVTHKNYQGFPTLKLLLLKLLRGLKTKNREGDSREGKILVITEVSNWRKEFDFFSNQFIIKDVYFQDIIKKLKETYNDVLVIDFENNPKRLLKSYSLNKQRSEKIGCDVVSWEKYLTLNIIRNAKSEHKKILQKWDEIKNLENFKEKLSYEEISLFSILEKDIESLFNSLKAFAAITLVDIAERILEIEKPSVIIMHDEYGALQISLIKAAKKLGIPTISLQHGIIHDDVFAYTHLLNHIKNKNKNMIFPLPEKMCVWSENAKQSLLRCAAFPVSVPIVTGDPKLDYLPGALKFFDNEKIRLKYKIKSNKKIILFITENLPLEEKIKIAKTVIGNKEVRDNFLIIKPHPNEKDLSIYHQLISEFGLKDYIIIVDSNLYEIIYVSNVIVLSFSTVGVEAMRIEKPVISLNLIGLHNSSLIIKNKMSIEVTNSDELSHAIKKIFEFPFSQKIIRERKDFAEKELGTLDGNAVNRITEQIIYLRNKYISSKKINQRLKDN